MELENRIKISMLCSYYGNMLTKNKKQITEDYVNENLSLGEIASQLGISRQAVKSTLDSSIKDLNSMESKLGFLKRDLKLKEKIKELIEDKNIETEIIKILEEF